MLLIAPGATGEAAGGPERFYIARMHPVFGTLRRYIVHRYLAFKMVFA